MKKHVLRNLMTAFCAALLSIGILNASSYYVDPASGSMSNSGTETSPWSTLAEVFSAGKTFVAGDVIYLKDGNHGFPNITQSNSGDVTIKSYPGHSPILNRLQFNGAVNWIVEGVRVYTSAAPPESPILSHPVSPRSGNFLIKLNSSSYVTFNECYIYSIEDESSWAANDWNYNAWNGLSVPSGSHHVTINNCLFKNLNFALDNSSAATHIVTRYSTIKNFCGDAMRTSPDGIIEYNEILDGYDTNGNHDDAMQGFGTPRVTIRGNKIINTTSSSRSLISYGLQGIGLFDGFFDDCIIENNLIVMHTWHGISIYGTRNSKIVNNTVVDNPIGSSSSGPPWIAVYNHKDGSASSGNVMRNNITSDIESTVGTTASNNLVTQSYTSHFVNYAALDMRLLSTSSAVDGGTTSDAPTIDLNQYPRTGNPDIGCYELGSVATGGDTEAPSVPTGLSSGTVTYNSVALSWSASTDNTGVIGYKIYTNGTNPVSVGGTSATVSGLSASTQYSFTVSAYDAAGNESAQSSAIQATTQQAPSGVTSDNTFQSFTLSTQTGEFTATFDATPNGNNIDALTGIQNGSASAYGDIACIIRFNSGGQIDARDGGSYAATNTINYSSGILYHFRVEVNVPTHTYSVFITPDGGSEQTVASNFAFRSEQASVSQLTGWTIYAYIGSHTVDNMAFSKGSDTQAPSVPTGLTSSNVTTSSVDLSWSASTDNVGVTGYKVYTDGSNPVTVTGTSATISGLSASTQYSFTVSAVDAASNESAQSSAIQVTTATPPDTQAPSVPTGLSSSNVTTSSVDLSWSASTDNVGVTGYKVYTDGSNPVSVAGTSTTISGLAASTQYSFTVSAIDAASNESAQSSAIQVTTATPPDTQAPSVPTGLSSSNVTTSSVDLSWSASTDNVGVTGYKVYTDGSNPVSVAGTSTTISGLAASTQYSFTVSAIDAASNESAQSSAIQVTTLATQTTITVDETIQAENYSSQSGCTVATDKAGYTGTGFLDYGGNGTWGEWTYISPGDGTITLLLRYANGGSTDRTCELTVNSVSQGNVTFVQTSLWTNWNTITVDIDVVEGSNTIRLTANTSYGGPNLDKLDLDGAVGGSSGGSDTEAPSVPIGLASNNVTTSSVDLSWTASTDNVGVTGYKVYTDGSNPVTVTGTSTTISGLAASTQYSFTVSAVDAASNESAQSSAIQATTATPPDTEAPSVPTGLASNNVTTSSVDLSWSASTDNVGVTGYKVYTDGSNPVTVTGTSTTISGLAASTQYSFTVSAIDAASNESAQSSALQVTTATPADTEAPSVPTGLTSGTVTSNSVALSWNTSTDNVGVTGYKVYTDGSNPVTVTGTSTTISGLAASTQYSFTVSAIDAASNESAQSSSVNATTSSASGVTSSSSWQSFALSTETGVFTATFDAVPNGSSIDALTGILDGTAGAYGDIACIIRFYTNGQIDARNGGSYAADNVINYTSGVSYHFRVEISVPTHAYNVYVTPQGGSEQTLASNFAFRSEQSSVSQLTGWTLYASSGSHTVSNMSFTPAAPDTEAPSVPTGLASSNIYSSGFTLSWTASTDNVGVTIYEVFKDGISIGTTGSTSMAVGGLSPETIYSMTVRAGDAVPNWSTQSSALSVTTTAGSADDWPTAETTGPSGTLTDYTGNFTANTNGQIIENMNISGKIYIKANNVLIRNCKFGSLDIATNDSYTGCVVEDSQLDWAGRHDFTLRRCEMQSQSSDLIRIGGGNITIEDCYLHIDGPRIGSDHSDIMQEYPVGTGSNNVVLHNRLYIAMSQNSILISTSNMLFEDNLLAGGSYSINVGSGCSVINNHFSTIFFPNCGSFGPFYSSNIPSQCSGNVWHETGAPLSCPSSGEIELTAENAEPAVKLYPNPLHGDVLNIQLNGYNTKTINVNIYDLTGRSVHNNLYVNNQSELKIPVSNLSKGIYVVSVNGKQQKLVVE